MVEKLKELMAQGKWIEYYNDPDDVDSFVFGRTLYVNDDEIVILEMANTGRYDGISWHPLDSIRYIQTDTRYCQKQETLRMPETFPSEIPDLDETNLRDSLLAHARKAASIVKLTIDGSDAWDVVGFVTEHKDGLYCFRNVDRYGFEDGNSYVEADRITAIEFDTTAAKRDMRLWNANRSMK